MSSKKFCVVLFGKTGSGKSASGNTILGRKAFVSKMSPTFTTKDITSANVTIGEVSLTVYDTPGLFDIERGNEEVLNQCKNHLHLEKSVFLLVIRPDRYTEEEMKTVEEIERFLGKERLKNTWILFTRRDELEDENTTIETFINDAKELKSMVQRFEDRYHIFNNKDMTNREQVTQLTKKIQERYCITRPASEPSLPRPERTLVLLGKSGVGKSATGNTILDGNKFNSELNSISVSDKSELKRSDVAGRQVSVIDTPGLYDTQLSLENLALELGSAVYLSREGLHAFLIVLRAGRYTKQEEQVIQLIKTLYGVEALKYAIILFTGGDELKGKSIEQLINDNRALSELVQQCGGRYHVFNNKDQSNRKQVTALLEKIDKMVEENGGRCYTNEMLEDAVRLSEKKMKEEERHKREAEEQALREKAERKRIKEQQREEEIAKVIRETEEKVKKEMEERKEKEQAERSSQEEQQREIETVSPPSGDGSPEHEGQGTDEWISDHTAAGIHDESLLAFLREHWKKFCVAASIVAGLVAVGGGVACILAGPVALGAGLTVAGVAGVAGAVGTAVYKSRRSDATNDDVTDETPLLEVRPKQE